jgi:cytoskeletal protein RodZ
LEYPHFIYAIALQKMRQTTHSIGGIEVVVEQGLEVQYDRTLPELVPSIDEKYSDKESAKLRGRPRAKWKINWSRRYGGVPIYWVILGLLLFLVGISVGVAAVQASREKRDSPSKEPDTSMTTVMGFSSSTSNSGTVATTSKPPETSAVAQSPSTPGETVTISSSIGATNSSSQTTTATQPSASAEANHQVR